MNTLTIAVKESKIYFSTPGAYVVGAMFLSLTGIFFVFDITAPFAEASVRGIVDWASFFIVFLAPILTMRLLAEEQKLGTLELLVTSPVRDWEVVLGKYIASYLILLMTLALTLYYVLLLYVFGQPDTGPLFAAYLGLLLHGAAALAIGLFGSSLSANQIVSAVVGSAILLILSFVDRIGEVVTGTAALVFSGMSMSQHVEDFSRGVIDTADVVYFVSIAAVFIFFTIRSLETRRWR
ncbi:MAG: ABC transporter permease [SAR202 cluster bacterium]|jgi:ABC-2 type transport system permease protein|nr:ABC transporter permease [SAR202 cluster bacterium]MDP6302551.1 ABC transporter permease [SAR202 cluster bacterium]MDP7103812.1 ABC transporter permease [SAR202 cluster bacterium]MDP7225326.1 ABC transporter permease [SAR202 cluster bacterium]MDP7413539.1 ABC transporter permease [SAR202 cluster bacterium]|tara:strand:- start:1873 stop:2583 length:711 start_codon:yes stop_codon:yes gene_type:complete